MTQKFLDTFFRGKWFYYGHFSMVLIIAFVTRDFYVLHFPFVLSGVLGAFTGWFVMFAKEVYDGYKGNFQ